MSRSVYSWPYRKVDTSYQNFDLLTWQPGSDQASLTTTDYAYTDRVMDTVEDMGCRARSPYRLGLAVAGSGLFTSAERPTFKRS